MTCKVRRDFKIITDVLSRVSLVTLNIRGSWICSPKSLYKKTSNEILRELKAAFRTGESKVPRPLSVLPSLLWQACVKQLALTHTQSPPRGNEKKDATKMNFSSCSDPSWIKMTAIFSSLTFEFEYFFFLRTSFFTAQNVGPMVHNHATVLFSWLIPFQKSVCPRRVMVKAMGCRILVCKFEIQLRSNV